MFSSEAINVMGVGAADRRMSLWQTVPTIPGMAPVPRPIPSVRSTFFEEFLGFIATNANNLQRHIDVIHGRGQRGGYVYFPPGRYYLGRPASRPSGSDQDADIFVPADVTLMFAPGAVLVPMNYETFGVSPRRRVGRPDEEHQVILEIEGDIEAGVHPIFDPILNPNDDGSPTYDRVLDRYVFGSARRAGKVIFKGTRVREVYPEWWGAFPNLNIPSTSARNRRAFQAAIDAAHTDRLRALRDPGGALRGTPERRVWRAEPTIPIVATYNYAIEGSLVVGRTAEVTQATDGVGRVNPAPFVLRGGREVGGPGKTLEAGASFARPMLDLDQVSSFYIEGVGFNANSLATICVRVRPGAEGGVGEFKRCTFQDLRDEAGGALVQVESEAPTEDAGPADEPAAPFHVAFTVCRMTPIRLDRDANTTDRRPGTLTFAERVSALVLDYDDRCTVELRGCHLQGHCDPMIRAIRGHFSLNETVFHANRRINGPTPPVTSRKPPGFGPLIAEWRAFWNSTNGTDIFLDRPPNAEGADGPPPASFTARECESQSFQFLSTWSGGRAAEGAALSACVLINVHHNIVAGGDFRPTQTQSGVLGGGADPLDLPREQARPGICWEGPGERGCHLIAMGCCFRSYYGIGAWPSGTVELGCIRLGPNQRGAIFHLANVVLGDDDYRHSSEEGIGVSPTHFVRTDPGLRAPVRVPALETLGMGHTLMIPFSLTPPRLP